ncbi:MAG: hypothetical protein AAGU73_11235, partial [Actinomycetota bacterium]
DSNTSAAPPSASATSPTTSPDLYSRPADSDPDYTLNCDEPSKTDLKDSVVVPGSVETELMNRLGISDSEVTGTDPNVAAAC